MKKSFLIYTNQKEIVDQLSDAEAGKLLKGLFCYANGETPILNKSIKLVFINIRQAIDAAWKNHEKVSQIRKESAMKRWKKPQKNALAYNGMQMHANAYDMDMDMDMDKKISTTTEDFADNIFLNWPKGGTE